MTTTELFLAAFWHWVAVMIPPVLLAAAVFAGLWVYEWSHGRHLPETLRELGDILTGRDESDR